MRPQLSSFGISCKDVENHDRAKSLLRRKKQKLFGPEFWDATNLFTLAKTFILFGGIPFYLVTTFGGSMATGLVCFLFIPGGLLFIAAIAAKIQQNNITLPKNIESTVAATERYLKAVSEYESKQYLIQQEENKKLKEQQKNHERFWFSLSGIEFECLLKELLEKNKYTQVKTTPYSGDGGIDLFAVDPSGKRVVFQCKAHSRPISPDDVRAFFGSFTALGTRVDYGVLVALSGTTSSGARFLRENGLKLWTVKDVVKMANT